MTSYGIPIIYLAVIILALAKFKKLPETDGRSEDIAYLIVGAMSIIALIECASAYYWVTAAFAPQTLFRVASQDLETSLTYAPYPIAPLVLLIIMFSWVWVPIVGRLTLRPRVAEGTPHVRPENQGEAMSERRRLFLFLDVFAILSILVFYFLYAAGQLWVVGVDSQWRYIIPLNTLNGLGFSQALGMSLRLGHGVYLGLLLIIERVTGTSSFLVVKYAPLALTFLTATFSFLAFRRVLSRNFPLLAAVCMILWIPTTIGIWGGIQSNWAAYVLWMFFLAFVFNQCIKSRTVSFLLQSLLSLGILIIHPWTWGVFLATLILAALFGIRPRADLKRGLTTVVSSTWLAAPVGAAAFIYLSGLTSDISNAITLYFFPFAHADSVFKLFPGAWLELSRVWSSFLSPTLILIMLVGAFALNELRGETKRYLLAWVAVWCVGSILVAAIGYLPADAAISETQLWRILYLSPLPILLALGVSRLVNLTTRFVITGPSIAPRLQPAVFSTAIGVFSLPLFLFEAPIIRLGSVIAGTLALLLLTYRFHVKDSPKLMTSTVLILIIVNAAFRSLFPLLLSPHNLVPSGI
jgi:hypothetical protein